MLLLLYTAAITNQALLLLLFQKSEIKNLKSKITFYLRVYG